MKQIKSTKPVLDNFHNASLHIATEARFFRDINGTIWSNDIHKMTHWLPYLKIFRSITIVARIESSDIQATESNSLSHPQISFCALSSYQGLKGAINVLPSIFMQLWNEARSTKIALLRIPGPIGILFGIFLLIRRKPFGCQIVGDAINALAGPGFSPLDRLSGKIIHYLCRIINRKSVATRYVTEQYLQNCYPPGAKTVVFSISDVRVTEKNESDNLKDDNSIFFSDKITISFCGSLSQMYKGLDTLIDAASILKRKNVFITVNIAGDGKYKYDLEKRAITMNVKECFRFHGHLSENKVIEMLDNSDVFVMPSRTEGLPRAMIEAMSRGLPCIGTSVGGIPELLLTEALVPPNNPILLAEKIMFYLDNPELMNRHAIRNQEFSRKFNSEKMDKLRDEFLKYLKLCSTV